VTERTPQPRPDGQIKDLEGRIHKLQDAATRRAPTYVTSTSSFPLFDLYLAIIFRSTTCEQSLRASPVTLPLLKVGLPLSGFYSIARALFVVLHLNPLIQLHPVSQQLHQLDGARRTVGGRTLAGCFRNGR
jgi:hypothetical protein